MTTNILPETIAARTSLTIRSVNAALNALEKHELIQRMGAVIKVLKPDHFEYFDQCLIGSVSSNSAMVALRMASCRLTHTPSIKMTDVDIIEKIGVGNHTFYAAKKELLEKGILIKSKIGCYLDTTFFPLVAPQVSDAFRERANMLLDKSRTEGYTAASRVFAYYYERGFDGLTMTPDELVVYCEAGCPGINHNKCLDTYEFPEGFPMD